MNVLDKPDTLDETWLDALGDNARCQMVHADPSNCTVHATHRVVSCRKSILMCDHATRYKRAQLGTGNACAGCGKAAIVCWKILPV